MKNITAFFFLLIIVAVNALYAGQYYEYKNDASWFGYRLDPPQGETPGTVVVEQEDDVSSGTDVILVQNKGCPPIFYPTRTGNEMRAFKDHHPSNIEVESWSLTGS